MHFVIIEMFTFRSLFRKATSKSDQNLQKYLCNRSIDFVLCKNNYCNCVFRFKRLLLSFIFDLLRLSTKSTINDN